MREYGKITPKFWTGRTGREIKKSGPAAMLVATYLMTSPHASMLGIYYLPIGYIATDTGLSIEDVEHGLAACVNAGFCRYCHDSEQVWVVKMAAYQIADKLKPGDNRVEAVRRAIVDLGECCFLPDFIALYGAAFHLSEAPTKPLRSPSEAPIQAPPKPESREQRTENSISLSSLSSELGEKISPSTEERPPWLLTPVGDTCRDEPDLSEEMQACIEWAKHDDFWKDKTYPVSAFLKHWASGDLRNQFRRHMERQRQRQTKPTKPTKIKPPRSSDERKDYGAIGAL